MTDTTLTQALLAPCKKGICEDKEADAVMEEYEVKLAMRMITHAIFSSDQAKELNIAQVKYYLTNFFSLEVLDEAQKRLSGLTKADTDD